MAVSTFVKNFTMGTLAFADGTGSPLTCTLPGSMGDFSLEGVSDVLNVRSDYQSRGQYTSSAYGERKFPSGSFTFQCREFGDAAVNSPMDWFQRTGAYAAAISTLPGGSASGTPWGFSIQYTIEGTNFGDSADHTFTLAKCAIDNVSFAEGDPSTFSVEFTVLGAISGDWAMTEL